MTCTVLIVEDNPMAARLLELSIENTPGYTVSGVLESAAVAEAWCFGHNVNLILMDVCTAGQASGLDASSKLKRSCPEIKIIIVTSQPEVAFIERARKAGVDSFWYKSSDERELLEVIKRTMAGESIWPDETPTIKIGAITSKDFTPLELRILRELTTGATNPQIGEKLGLSPRTIGNNIQKMLDKTGCSTRTMLACIAVESGIVIKNI